MVETEGNLISLALKGHFDIIAHGCNCGKMMGAGIALEMKARIPEAWEADLKDKRFSINKLGCFTSALVDREEIKPFLVLNFYSQYEPGKNLDVEALTLCLRKTNMMYPDLHIGLPYIGAGIAGGDWKEIKKIIKKELKDMRITIVKYKK